ncbi:hypothetical protein H6F77_04265 [Microcoleus sp. FACHB-831]|uniref:hypothetical protein n=1 Tax=Microcoleus sp. FACHB-831 TaxID=2692827 RepID=UPI00168A12EF|nr:hypothetical protein [Microcoleus sp. FACHB-831]MBD1920332.1 hypothetical protein [Microcoleus sp. FACHB-831]
MNKKVISLALVLGMSTLFLGACGDNSSTSPSPGASPGASPGESPAKPPAASPTPSK